MPIFSVGTHDRMVSEVYVDGVRHKYVFFADTDEGFVCEWVVEPVQDKPDTVKIKRNTSGQPLVETVWGKVEIRR